MVILKANDRKFQKQNVREFLKDVKADVRIVPKVWN